MKLLGWDTSSKAGVIVALEWETRPFPSEWKDVHLVSELSLNVDCTHSERLLWGIHQVLEAARWKLEEIDVFAVGNGPGSFTGLRIGITTARTLAHVFNKKLIGVSSLAALARPVALHFAELSSSMETWVIATTDACKGELFALWGSAQNVAHYYGAPGPVSEAVIQPAELMLQLNKHHLPWVAVGEGRRRYLEYWMQLSKTFKELQPPYLFSDFVQGRFLGQLAWEAYQASLQSDHSSKDQHHPLEVFPRYLRASHAELKLKTKN